MKTKIRKRQPAARAAVCLLSDERLAGQYVAIRSLAQREVIASGRLPARVLDTARRKGIASPVVFFVPKEDVACLY